MFIITILRLLSTNLSQFLRTCFTTKLAISWCTVSG